MDKGTWNEFLTMTQAKPEWKDMVAEISHDRSVAPVYPAPADVFNAFRTDFDSIKVVLLGQDPYHTPGVADGLAFSTRSASVPPSLLNMKIEIFKSFYDTEDRDIKHIYFEPEFIKFFPEGVNNLSYWASQGVFLLNTALTVIEGKPNSHAHLWSWFTEEVFKYLQKKDKLVYMLLGRNAQNYKTMIPSNKYDIVEAPHPSPLSAHTGFFGSGCFMKANNHLFDWHGNYRDQIHWALNPDTVDWTPF